MPLFSYQARNATGEKISGRANAASESGVAETLRQQGLTPTAISLYRETISFKNILTSDVMPRKLKAAELSLFCRQMYAMLKAGVPIISALTRIAETTRDRSFQKILKAVVSEVSGGRTVSTAMQQHPRVFKQVIISVVSAGEQSGQMEEAFLQLAQYFELEDSAMKRFKSASRYPMIVLVILVAAIVVVNFFVIPSFAGIFTAFHTQLPLPTRILLGSSQIFKLYWPQILAIVVILIILVRMYIGLESGRIAWDHLKLRIPIIGSLIERIILGRFARIFSMLLHSGVPLARSVELLSQVMGNQYVGQLVLSMKVSVEKGESILQSASRTGLFSKMVLQMIAIGEETGALDSMLENVALFYEREVDYDLDRLLELLQPFLIIVVGGFVLMLALGIFLPMWNMIDFAKLH